MTARNVGNQLREVAVVATTDTSMGDADHHVFTCTGINPAGSVTGA